MILWIALLAQSGATAIPADPPPPAVPVDRFDLRDLPERTDDGDVIVVRANVERYRLKDDLDPRYEEDGKAEFGLFGDTRAAIETEAEEIAPGVVSKRLMFRIKLPL